MQFYGTFARLDHPPSDRAFFFLKFLFERFDLLSVAGGVAAGKHQPFSCGDLTKEGVREGVFREVK